ncbi:MAG: hypothetical protein ABGW77_02055, partial [Campylobacterales bacterium]
DTKQCDTYRNKQHFYLTCIFLCISYLNDIKILCIINKRFSTEINSRRIFVAGWVGPYIPMLKGKGFTAIFGKKGEQNPSSFWQKRGWKIETLFSLVF